MSSHDGLGSTIDNSPEFSTGFDAFEIPSPSNDIISSGDIEIRLFTVLDRY